MTTEYSSKISALGSATLVGESDLFPISVRKSETQRLTIDALREVIGFENAYPSLALALLGTKDGDIFYVFETADNLWVLKYKNVQGTAVAVTDSANVQIKKPTDKTLKELSEFIDLPGNNFITKVIAKSLYTGGKNISILKDRTIGKGEHYWYDQSNDRILANLNGLTGDINLGTYNHPFQEVTIDGVKSYLFNLSELKDRFDVRQWGVAGIGDETAKFNAACVNSKVFVPRGIEVSLTSTGSVWSTCVGIYGEGAIRITDAGNILTGNDFSIRGIKIFSNIPEGLSILGTPDISNQNSYAKNLVIENVLAENQCTEDDNANVLAIRVQGYREPRYSKIVVRRGTFWQTGCLGFTLTNSMIDAASAGAANPTTNWAGSDCIKATLGSYGTIGNVVLLNAGRDFIDIYSAGRNVTITGVVGLGARTEGIEIKTADPVIGTDQYCREIVVTGCVFANCGEDTHAIHGVLNIRDSTTNTELAVKNVICSNIVMFNVGAKAGPGSVYCGAYVNGCDNILLSNILMYNIYNNDYTCYGVYVRQNKFTRLSNISIRGVKDRALVIYSDNVHCDQITIDRSDEYPLPNYGIFVTGYLTNSSIVNTKVKAAVRAFNADTALLQNVDLFAVNFEIPENAANICMYLNEIIDVSLQGRFIGAYGSDIIYMTTTRCKSLKVFNSTFKRGRYGVYLRNAVKSILTGSNFDEVTQAVNVMGGNYNIIKDNIADGALYAIAAATGASIVNDNLTLLHKQLGDYTTLGNITITNLTDFVTYQNIRYYPVSVPYTTNTTANPNPINDANLQRFVGLEA